MTDHRLSRRQLLTGTAASLAALAFLSPFCYLEKVIPWMPFGWVYRLMKNDPALQNIGSVYLRDHPEEANIRFLAAAVFTRSLPDVVIPWIALRSLRRKIIRDFSEGSIITVNGWALSRTEARLAALCALLQA